jgi:hypothetical protein
MVDVAIWDGWAGGHHLANVAASCCQHVFVVPSAAQDDRSESDPDKFIRPFGAKRSSTVWRSVLVAALFAVHPLQVESVARVAERKDVLSTFFSLLALGAYLPFTRQRSAKQYAITCGWFILGLMAKAMSVTIQKRRHTEAVTDPHSGG